MGNAPAAVGRFQVVDTIGRGGMGTLFLAWDPSLEREVAIKLLREDDTELRERFSREARSAARLRHVNIVTIFDVGEHDGQPFIAMEYIQGETLADLVQRKAPLPTSRRLQLIEDLCDGLGFAHAAGIVHRDIKPANVMVDRAGIVKILDFGIARANESSSLTQAGMLIGTLNYMSPEQVSGQAVDHRSDIFAVGALLYELLAYRAAFPGKALTAVLHTILTKSPEPLTTINPNLDPDIAAVVDRALAKDPDDRYQDLDSLRQDLQLLRRRLDTTDQLTEIIPVGGASGFRRPPSGSRRPPSGSRRQTDPQALAERRAKEIESILGRAAARLEEGDFEGAIKEGEHALLLDADEPRVHDLINRARDAIEARQAEERVHEAAERLEAGALTQARQLVDEARELVPDQPDATQLSRRIDDAVAERDAARARAAAITTGLAAARDHLAAGRFDDARQAAADVLALDESNADARALDTEAERAHEAARRAATIARHLSEAGRLESQGRLAQALKAAEAALAVEPGHGPARDLQDRLTTALEAENARRKAEEAAKRKAAEEARQRAELEAKRQAEAEARRKAEEAAKRKAAEEARQRAELEAKRQAKAEAEARRKAEEAAKRKADERKAAAAARRATKGPDQSPDVLDETVVASPGALARASGGAAPPVAAPPPASSSVGASLPSAATSPAERPVWMRWPALAAAAVVVMALGYLVLGRGGQPDEPAGTGGDLVAQNEVATQSETAPGLTGVPESGVEDSGTAQGPPPASAEPTGATVRPASPAAGQQEPARQTAPARATNQPGSTAQPPPPPAGNPSSRAVTAPATAAGGGATTARAAGTGTAGGGAAATPPAAAVEEDPIVARVRTLRERAIGELRQGQQQQAMRTAESILALSPDDVETITWLTGVARAALQDAAAARDEATSAAAQSSGEFGQAAAQHTQASDALSARRFVEAVRDAWQAAALFRSAADAARNAPPPVVDETAAVQDALQAYADAMGSLDASRVVAIHPTVNRTALEQAFGQLDSQRITIVPTDMEVDGATATVRAQVRTVARPKNNSRDVESPPVAVTFRLEKRNGRWVIVERR